MSNNLILIVHSNNNLTLTASHGRSDRWLWISYTLTTIIAHGRFILLLGIVSFRNSIRIIFAFWKIIFHFGDIRSLQKHSRIVDGHSVAMSNVYNYALEFVWLESNFSSFLFGLQNNPRHVDVKSFFIEVTRDFNLRFLWLLICVIWVSALIHVIDMGFIDSVLNCYKDAVNRIVWDVSIHDKS